jgi:hypothetical protein
MGHAYSVLAYSSALGLITVRNPWHRPAVPTARTGDKVRDPHDTDADDVQTISLADFSSTWMRVAYEQ